MRLRLWFGLGVVLISYINSYLDGRSPQGQQCLYVCALTICLVLCVCRVMRYVRSERLIRIWANLEALDTPLYQVSETLESLDNCTDFKSMVTTLMWQKQPNTKTIPKKSPALSLGDQHWCWVIALHSQKESIIGQNVDAEFSLNRRHFSRLH